jgi:hypothetical protein
MERRLLDAHAVVPCADFDVADRRFRPFAALALTDYDRGLTARRCGTGNRSAGLVNRSLIFRKRH